MNSESLNLQDILVIGEIMENTVSDSPCARHVELFPSVTIFSF